MNNHLDHQQMLAYLDGELSRAETHKAEKHLHSCWTCRTEVEHLKSDIATILDSQREMFSPALPSPPSPWPTFNMLMGRSAPTPRPSTWMRMVAAIGTMATPSRIFAASMAVVGIVAVTFATFRSPVVSAKEVLRHIEVADAKRSDIGKDNVIRERVHIRRTTRNTGRQDSTVADTWRSRKAAYWENSKNDPVLFDLESEYKSHGVPLSLPLSASSTMGWGNAMRAEPNVTRSGEDLDLTYVPAGTHSDGIERVSFRVQPDNWTVKQMTIGLPDASFEVTEDDFDIVPVSSVPPMLLAELELPPFPTSAPQSVIHPLPHAEYDSTRVGTVDLNSAEIDVFATLHRLKVDLGDPVTVTRTQNSVQVGVWQLPEDRQNELRAALSGKPGIQVLTSSPRSVIAKATVSLPSSETSGPIHIAVDSAGDERLLKFFGSSEREQEFTAQALATSTTMLSHLYALRNLEAQFSPEREQSLSQEDRDRLAVLVRDHAAAISSSLDALRTQLEPLDTNFDVLRIAPAVGSSTGDWQRGCLESLETGRAIDHLLRSLLTTNQQPTPLDSALPDIERNISRLMTQTKELAPLAH